MPYGHNISYRSATLLFAAYIHSISLYPHCIGCNRKVKMQRTKANKNITKFLVCKLFPSENVQSKTIYNATTQNNPEIDTVHNDKLYIATVSIKHKAADHIKTVLLFWFNTTRLSAQK